MDYINLRSCGHLRFAEPAVRLGLLADSECDFTPIPLPAPDG